MVVASLILTGVLAAGSHAAAPDPQRPIQPRTGGQSRAGQGESSRPTGDRLHTLGVGGSMMVSNRGASGGFRYFFGERVGLSLAAGWSSNGPRSRSGSSAGSTTIIVPSVMVMLTKPDDTRQVDIRPYVGGGVTYIYATDPHPPTTPGSTLVFESRGGVGGQVFGGAEVSFINMPRFTISGEGTYYTVPTNFVSTSTAGGFNYGIAFHFYLK